DGHLPLALAILLAILPEQRHDVPNEYRSTAANTLAPRPAGVPRRAAHGERLRGCEEEPERPSDDPMPRRVIEERLAPRPGDGRVPGLTRRGSERPVRLDAALPHPERVGGRETLEGRVAEAARMQADPPRQLTGRVGVVVRPGLERTSRVENERDGIAA